MKMLVVDDQATSRQLIRWVVEEDGHQVEEAENGEVAIEKLHQFEPDIILLDILMPILNGYDTAAYIKDNYNYRHIPIIFLTGVRKEEELARGLAAGGHDFLLKPISVVVLRAKLEAHQRVLDMQVQLEQQNKELTYFRQRIEHEHELAEAVFESAVKEKQIGIDNINAYLSPMMAFNGDLFLSTRKPSGAQIFMLGDFTGHGLSASIGTIPASLTFYDCANKGLVVGDIVQEINRTLLKVLPSHMFCAASVVELSLDAKTLTVWAGGLPDAYIVHKNGGVRRKICSSHMPLGILDNQEFDRSVEIIPVEIDERFYTFTDGLTETQNAQGEMFDDDRFEKIANSGQKDIFACALSALYEFASSTDQDDDVSLIELICRPAKALDPQTNEEEYVRSAPWYLNIKLCRDDFLVEDQIDSILNMIGTSAELKKHKDTLYIILMELYSNSLEYGILNLDSSIKSNEEGYMQYYDLRKERLKNLVEGSISFEFKLQNNGERGLLYIKVKDSGVGFDINKIETADDDLYSGRGINLIRSLCEKVEYSKCGREANVVYKI